MCPMSTTLQEIYARDGDDAVYVELWSHVTAIVQYLSRPRPWEK